MLSLSSLPWLPCSIWHCSLPARCKQSFLSLLWLYLFLTVSSISSSLCLSPLSHSANSPDQLAFLRAAQLCSQLGACTLALPWTRPILSGKERLTAVLFYCSSNEHIATNVAASDNAHLLSHSSVGQKSGSIPLLHMSSYPPERKHMSIQKHVQECPALHDSRQCHIGKSRQ